MFGSDPKVGIRPYHTQRNMFRQHRLGDWGSGGASGSGSGDDRPSLQDVMSELDQIRDRPIDIVTTTGLGQHVDVQLTWTGYVRKEIYLIGEFNGWRPEISKLS